MADLFGVANSMEKLNNSNYGNWSIRMRYYLIGQDLWDIVGEDNTTPPVDDTVARKQWEMKSGKAMFVLTAAVEDDQMHRIRSAKTPKEAWEILKTAFAKRNEAKLQRLENELFSISQRDLTVRQYFSKVKSLCEDISRLDPDNEINETRMRRIIIHGLRPECKGLVTATRGWATQPTLEELENILSNEESLDDKMSKVAAKEYEEALFTGNRCRSTKNDRWRRRDEGAQDHWRRRDGGDRDQWRNREEDDREERRSQLGGAQRRDGRSSESHQPRRFDGICYKCGKKGHIARNCRSKKPVESHAVIASEALIGEEEWDLEALAAMGDGESNSQASTVIEEEDWDFGDPMMITEDYELDVSMAGEEVKSCSSEERKMELLETEEEIDEHYVELPEMQRDNEEGEEIKISEVEVD